MDLIRLVTYNLGIAAFSGILLGILILLHIKTTSERVKLILVYFSTPLIAIIFFEIYYFTSNKSETEISFTGSYADNPMVSGPKAVVGYGPRPDTCFQVSAIRKNGDSLVYDVVYSFKDGKRVTPDNNNLSKHYVFFLGCSVTFGDGLNDKQTLPYYFSQGTNNECNVTNYAFSGYGPHQALKIIEEYILKNKELSLSENSCAVYSFIPEHYDRCAGRSIWDNYGPWYEVEDDNLVYKGSFSDKKKFKENYVTKRIKSIWRKSAIYKTVLKPKVSKKDVHRLSKIIESMNKTLLQHNVRFIMLIPRPILNNTFETILYETLEKNNIEHYFVSSIIPPEDLPSHKIKGDGHPNEKYNMKIAEFLALKFSAQ